MAGNLGKCQIFPASAMSWQRGAGEENGYCVDNSQGRPASAAERRTEDVLGVLQVPKNTRLSKPCCSGLLFQEVLEY